MERPPNPVDIILWQIAGVLVGVAPGVTAALMYILHPVKVTPPWFGTLVCATPFCGVLGGVVGSLWGARRRRR
jgi:hypothetical protein